MAKSLDLPEELFKSKPKVPHVIRPREIKNIHGVRGTLPLRAGEVVLTPAEQQKLLSFGWKPGDPIPGNLPEFVRGFNQATRELPEEVRQEILTTPSAPRGTPPTKFPQPIDICQLNPDKRAEIEQYLNEFKQHAPQIEKAIKARGGMDRMAPSVQKAIVAAESAGIELIDSRQEQQGISEALGTNSITADDIQRKIDVAEGKLQPECDPDDQQCQLLPEPELKVDYADKAAYLTSIMAMKPFRKNYSLFDGRIHLVFRQISTEQAEMVLSQVSHTSKVGLVSQEESVQLGHMYWAILSLESISFQGELTVVSEAVNHAIQKWKDSLDDDHDGDPTPLPELAEIIRKTPPFHNISVWRSVIQYHGKFDELIRTMEAKADSPDFWIGIGA